MLPERCGQASAALLLKTPSIKIALHGATNCESFQLSLPSFLRSQLQLGRLRMAHPTLMCALPLTTVLAAKYWESSVRGSVPVLVARFKAAMAAHLRTACTRVQDCLWPVLLLLPGPLELKLCCHSTPRDAAKLQHLAGQHMTQEGLPCALTMATPGSCA